MAAHKQPFLADFAEGTLSLFKGLWVTLINWRQPRVTVQYPFKESLARFPRYRGRMVHLRDQETGRLRCTACMACVKACPANVLSVVGDAGKGREKRAAVYEWRQTRCMFCNLCVEACPFNAIVLGNASDAPAYNREELTLQLDALLDPWQENVERSTLSVERENK
jgi:NADH-quinone oxidoreductase subunit I